MWNQKISMSIGNHYSMPTPDIVKLLACIGFDGISPEWNAEVDLSPVVDAAAQHGLGLVSIHAPFGGAANMWGTDAADAAKSDLFGTLEACRRFSIPVMVVHNWIGFDYTFGDTAHGFANFGEVVEHAVKYGVKIAFENTEGDEYLYALMNHFNGNDTVGFCWDSGHELCYNHSRDLLADFGDRLLVTHLNDNLGISRYDGKTFWTDDLHLLPWDGIADWDDNIARLKRSRRLEYLNFELTTQSKPGRHENDCYARMSLEEYFTEVYKRACRVAYRYSR